MEILCTFADLLLLQIVHAPGQSYDGLIVFLIKSTGYGSRHYFVSVRAY